MSETRTVLAQILSLVPRREFERLAREHGAAKHVRSFPCWAQLGCLVYAQLSRQTSLRDLVIALATKRPLLYHCFGTTAVRRTTLADANEHRSYKIYESLFIKLYEQCKIQAPEHRFRFRNKLYSFDSSTVDLCLNVFPWAKFRTIKGAIKLHTLLDHEGQVPSVLRVTTGSTHDIQQARKLHLEPDSILAFDRGYVDYQWFYQLDLQEIYFVTRLKRGATFRVIARREPPPLSGVTSDQTIRIVGSKADSIPIDLRRIGYVDPATGHRYYFLTNLFRLSAKTIAEIYRSRWQVEDTFRNVKQPLGGEDPQTWRYKGPERAASLSLWLYSAIWSWYIATQGTKHTWPALPWYTSKKTPSFADALAALRRALWRERIFAMSASRSLLPKMAEAMIEVLARAA